MKTKKIFLAICFIALAIAIITGCASLKVFLTGANTSLVSTSLSAANAMRAAGITVMGTLEGSSWLITPHKISGKIMSVVLPINGTEDDGVVPFGSGRPDIAPANTTLYDFDLSTTTRLHTDSLGMKPGFKGGKAQQIILLFGYFDVRFLQGTTTREIRFVYGDTTPYIRGDKLLYNAEGASTNKFYWYNTSSDAFVIETATRPTYPSINNYVATFSDPIRPNMHYYMLGAMLRNCTDYDGTRGVDFITLNRSLIEDNDMTFAVDFDVQNAVVFSGVSSEADFNSLTDAQLIQKFDMVQNVSRWSQSGLYCGISLEVVKKY